MRINDLRNNKIAVFEAIAQNLDEELRKKQLRTRAAQLHSHADHIEHLMIKVNAETPHSPSKSKV